MGTVKIPQETLKRTPYDVCVRGPLNFFRLNFNFYYVSLVLKIYLGLIKRGKTRKLISKELRIYDAEPSIHLQHLFVVAFS